MVTPMFQTEGQAEKAQVMNPAKVTSEKGSGAREARLDSRGQSSPCLLFL